MLYVYNCVLVIEIHFAFNDDALDMTYGAKFRVQFLWWYTCGNSLDLPLLAYDYLLIGHSNDEAWKYVTKVFIYIGSQINIWQCCEICISGSMCFSVVLCMFGVVSGNVGRSNLDYNFFMI